MMPCPRCLQTGEVYAAGNRIARPCPSCEGKGFITESMATQDDADREIEALRLEALQLRSIKSDYEKRIESLNSLVSILRAQVEGLNSLVGVLNEKLDQTHLSRCECGGTFAEGHPCVHCERKKRRAA